MQNSKVCPYCSEEIKFEAIKCKHCHSMLTKKDDELVDASNNRAFVSEKKESLLKQWWVWVVGFVTIITLIVVFGGNGSTLPATTNGQQQAQQVVTGDVEKTDNENESAHELLYMETAVRIIEDISLYTETLAIALDPRVKRDEAWAGVIEASTSLVHMSIDEIHQMEAPERFKDSHRYLLLYADELTSAMDSYAAHNIEKGHYHFNEAVKHLNIATELAK